jgi:predicted methyltransferase|tara:strand:- start:1322 stop:2221 length:900 start_codon:yes stop_codon:yes gene_type:complete
MRFLIILAASIIFGACSQPEVNQTLTAEVMPMAGSTTIATNELSAILAAQPEAVQDRYVYRHPEETLNFFGIKPGMTVVEVLPGGGWYSKLLLPHLGTEGQLVGANYPRDIWPLFGFFSEERIAKLATWTTDWPAGAQEWRSDNSASVSAFEFGKASESLRGTADAVLFFRALHNLARFENQGEFLTTAIADSYNVLKPGGIAGVVQHHAPDSASDEWADGSRGYLKKAFVITKMQAAGFEFLASSDVNANSKDEPTVEDVVWRLPPTLRGAKDDAEQAAKMLAIGESNRMTLKFRKPL